MLYLDLMDAHYIEQGNLCSLSKRADKNHILYFLFFFFYLFVFLYVVPGTLGCLLFFKLLFPPLTPEHTASIMQVFLFAISFHRLDMREIKCWAALS